MASIYGLTLSHFAEFSAIAARMRVPLHVMVFPVFAVAINVCLVVEYVEYDPLKPLLYSLARSQHINRQYFYWVMRPHAF